MLRALALTQICKRDVSFLQVVLVSEMRVASALIQEVKNENWRANPMSPLPLTFSSAWATKDVRSGEPRWTPDSPHPYLQQCGVLLPLLWCKTGRFISSTNMFHFLCHSFSLEDLVAIFPVHNYYASAPCFGSRDKMFMDLSSTLKARFAPPTSQLAPA